MARLVSGIKGPAAPSRLEGIPCSRQYRLAMRLYPALLIIPSTAGDQPFSPSAERHMTCRNCSTRQRSMNAL
jgi:hypothetical protein